MENPVLIFGAGVLGQVTLDIFQRNSVVVYGFLDDKKELHGREFGDVSVLGDTDDDGYLKLVGQKCEACIAIADSRVRRRLVKLLNERRKVQPVNAIHDTATIASTASLGHGNLIGARVVVNPSVTVGQHVILEAGAIIDTGVTLGDFVNIGSGAIVGSGAVVEEGSFIGTGAVLVAGVRVGKNARIGAGSVVVENVAAGATVFGNPAQGIS